MNRAFRPALLSILSYPLRPRYQLARKLQPFARAPQYPRSFSVQVKLAMPKRKLSTPSEEDDASTFAPSAAEEDPEDIIPVKKASSKRKTKAQNTASAATGEEAEEEAPAQRPPDVNSDRLPLPWKGRIGYACLNTYLRTSSPPIFCSRTCRIDTILKHGAYRLKSGAPGPGLEYVQSLGLQNAKDLSKLIEWNERYGIKFLRISSEMFPFASHPVYGYDLDFAKPVLEEAGKLAMKYGHRLTTHPGQFTQIASPRKEVIEASVKDLEYHVQLLRNLGLQGQQDRDAVMILHMGGMFGDKEATLKRFHENYTKLLTDEMKARLVLENDDVSWSVHDLLPTCEALNIPLVLDYHHHNIIHSPALRAGTLDIIPLFPRIKATWTRKSITQKQHYSEPCLGAVTDRQMRKHSPRVKTLPPCDPDMDLMIEAKDKEQAVFELYRKFGIFTDFNEVIPHQRTDENREVKVRGKKAQEEAEKAALEKVLVSEEEIGMGGEERRVYWPEGKEEWLSPAKRVTKKAKAAAEAEIEEAITNETAEVADDPAPPAPAKSSRARAAKKQKIKAEEEVEEEDEAMDPATTSAAPKPTDKKKKASKQQQQQQQPLTPKGIAVKQEAASPSAATATRATTTRKSTRTRKAAVAAVVKAARPPTPKRSSSSDLSTPPAISEDDDEEEVVVAARSTRSRRKKTSGVVVVA